MGKYALRASIALIISGSTFDPAPASRRERPARLDVEAFTDTQVAEYLQASAEPSLSIVLVWNGRVLLEKGYGFEDSRGTRQVDPAMTAFNIASVSKVLTTIAVMQEVEQGRLELDADITRYLGGLGIAGRVASSPTVRSLLTHTSGLDGPFMRDVVASPDDLVPLEAYFRRFPPVAARPPGSEIRYSNYGMALAGHLVERVSGQPFAEYVEKRIFVPLGMTRSSFRQPPPDPIASRVATAGSGPVPDALLPFPAGSAVSSVHDMGRLLQALLNGGRLGDARILSEETVQMMHDTQWAADPRVPGVTLGLFETGLGGTRGLFHTGARTHFSLFYLAPEHSLGIFVVHSMRQGGRFQNLRANFVRAFLDEYVVSVPRRSPAEAPPAEPSDPHAARSYAGVYRPILLSQSNIERAAWMAMDTRVRVEDDGTLAIAVPGGPTLRAVPIGTHLFEITAGAEEGMRVVFSAPSSCCGMRMSLSGATQDPVSFDRLSWAGRGLLHAVVLGSVLLLCAGCVVWAAAYALAASLSRTRQDRPTVPSGARIAWRLGVAASTCALLGPISIAAIVMLHGGDDTAAGNLRLALTIGLSCLVAALPLALTLPIFAIRAWRYAYWSLARRVYFTALAAGLIAAIPLLYYYRLLGYWISL